MSLATRIEPTLIAAIWPAERQAAIARMLVLAVLGSALMTVSAKIQVPMYPVPQTMQTYVVLVIGMAYGWRLGAATIGLYLAQGAIGLPVFASGAGFAYLMGPTGGYLFGFLAAAVAVGWLAERGWDRNIVLTVVAMVIGTAVIFGLGVGYLSSIVGVDRALEAGLMPFLFGAGVKIALGTATMPLAWRLVRKYRDG